MVVGLLEGGMDVVLGCAESWEGEDEPGDVVVEVFAVMAKTDRELDDLMNGNTAIEGLNWEKRKPES